MTKRTNILAASILAAVAFLPAAALGQTTVADDLSPPLTSTGQPELLLRSYTVPGGSVDCAIVRPGGIGGAGTLNSGGCAFVPGGGGSITRYLALVEAKADTGVSLTATATGGAVGVKRTAGTSLTLDGETASSGAATDKAMWELNLPSTYVPGANIPVIVNANYTGAGTPTAATTTITVTAYTEVNGVEAALTVSAAQQFTGVAANYTFTITGTGLVVGSHIVIEVTMLVTNAASTNVGHINSVAYNG